MVAAKGRHTPGSFRLALVRGRRQFAGVVASLGAVWLSNEGPGVVPDLPVPGYEGAPFVLGTVYAT